MNTLRLGITPKGQIGSHPDIIATLRPLYAGDAGFGRKCWSGLDCGKAIGMAEDIQPQDDALLRLVQYKKMEVCAAIRQWSLPKIPCC